MCMGAQAYFSCHGTGEGKFAASPYLYKLACERDKTATPDPVSNRVLLELTSDERPVVYPGWGR
jgi:hypothetical protein